VLLAGCSSPAPNPTAPLAITPPTPTGPAAAACARLSHALPTTVAGLPRRPTEPPTDTTAAWGNPPVVLLCGTAAQTVPATAQLVVVDGVSWYPQTVGGGYVFASVGRAAEVALFVPASVNPAGTALADVSPVVAARVPAAR